jgi:soluble lytic murein transglycosylase-like protein
VKKLTFIFVAFTVFALSVECSGAHAQAPEAVYYADAYADHYGVPRALVHAIIAQESAWNPMAISKKNAEGLMQLMPATAAMYGVGNRFSVIENLGGGVQYLSELLTVFHGDMRLAVAAYYCGPIHILQEGLAYRNPDVLAYVEAVRARYRREVSKEAGRGSVPLAGGN